ncbi:MAG: hypothetical protein MI861_07210, partial [Pirellulales bacterium]|nr:hypothetical protein [Pirellulales bacterium]
MNRHALAHGHRVAGIAAALWLLSTMDASAQFQMPKTTVPPVATSATPHLASGQQAISDARLALARKDYHNAVQAYRRAAAAAPTHPQFAKDIATLRTQLQNAGIDSALLATSPAPPQRPKMKRLPSIGAASPMAAAPGQVARGQVTRGQVAPGQAARGQVAPASRKADALRLLAIGRAALDRGDAATALALAKQAQALQVPEREFAANEPRVWQLLLDAESAASRSGVALTSGQQSAVNGQAVRQAVGTATDNEVENIAQMLFSAEAGQQTGNVNAIQQVQSETPLPRGGQVNRGQRLFNDGLAALSRGDKEAARHAFLEAWKFQADLDPASRNQLKDKLTLLQPVRTLESTGVPPAELTPIQRAELESQEQTRRLYREVTAELAKANEIKTDKPMMALEQLERLRRRVDGSNIAESARRPMAIMVNRAITEQQQYIDANRAQINQDLKNASIRNEIATEQAREASVDKEITSLVDTFNGLMRERRYPEAEIVA